MHATILCILGILLLTQSAVGFILLKADHECNSDDHDLTDKNSVEECAAACQAKASCHYFKYGKASKAKQCFHETTTTDSCSEGWDSDVYDFYSLGKTVGNYELGAAGNSICAGTVGDKTRAYIVDKKTCLEAALDVLKGGALDTLQRAAESNRPTDTNSNNKNAWYTGCVWDVETQKLYQDRTGSSPPPPDNRCQP